MILITGAAGKTGQAVMAGLAARGQAVRALVHRAAAVEIAQRAGAAEVVVGEMLAEADLCSALCDVEAVYHICPNMHAEEVTMAEVLLRAMAQVGVRRVVYHSVLHPQIEVMPHHWRKLRVEELLFAHDVEWTILQPAAYMQNVSGYWQAIVHEGIYRVPYAASAKLGMVDLQDVAEAAATVLVEPGYTYGIYELAGREILDQVQVAAVLAQALGRPVEVEVTPRVQWAEQARRGGMEEDAIRTLLAMFEYYEAYGFYGSPSVLRALLGREPATFADVVGRWVRQSSES